MRLKRWLINLFANQITGLIISEIQIGGNCGLCGAWIPDVLVERAWPWAVCKDGCPDEPNTKCPECGNELEEMLNLRMDEQVKVIPICQTCQKAFRIKDLRMWYKDDCNELYVIENDIRSGITKLMGHRLEDGTWEYAVIHWWYHSCTPLVIVRDGKVVRERPDTTECSNCGAEVEESICPLCGFTVQ